MDLLVIANPHAGRGRGARVLAQVEKHLKNKGMAHRTALSGWAGHTVEIASQASRDGCTCLVLVGGDGTLLGMTPLSVEVVPRALEMFTL